MEGGWGETTGQLGRETDGKAGGGWGRGRPARDDSGKRKPAGNHLFSIISHPAARLEAAPPEVTRCLSRRSRATSGGAASCRAQPRGECAAERPHRILSLFTFHLSLRPKGATASCRAQADGEREETGEENLQECLECRRASPDGWETGGMSTLKPLRGQERLERQKRARQKRASPCQSLAPSPPSDWKSFFWNGDSFKGSVPNADQISSAHPWNNPARSPFSSACGAKHGARGGRRHGDFPGRSFALPKTSLSRVWPAFFGCEVSSNTRSIQNSPCLRASFPSVFGAAGPSIKGKALSDQHSGQTPPEPGEWKGESRAGCPRPDSLADLGLEKGV